MNVAVTGGTGVVGTALLRRLVEAGHRVRALSRSSESGDVLAGLGVEPISGDVLDRTSLGPLVDGSDWVFHVAGVNELCSKEPDSMDRVNIGGTANILAACRSAGVGRLVHTSSAVTMGEAHGTIGSESSAHRGTYLSGYERSKHLSEKLLFENAGDLDVVAVNPSSVQGPGRATGTGKLVLDVMNGRLPFLVETNVSIVDIDDCARGHLLAAENGASGERYLLSGASFSITEVIRILGDVTGRHLDPKFVPCWLATAGAAVVEGSARIVGRTAPVCREMMRVLRAGHVYDGSRATRDLGLQYTPFELTIRRTVDWFDEQGLLA